MVNKVRVNIAGTPYAIATTDPEKYILSLAKKLDEDITKLLDDNANLSVTKAAVFCAMDYLDEYRKSTGSAENMRSQIQDYIADATRAKLAEDKVKAENEVLRREAAALREQLEKMRNKEARREERAQQAAQQSVAEGEADKAEYAVYRRKEKYVKDRDPCPGGQRRNAACRCIQRCRRSVSGFFGFQCPHQCQQF